MPAPPSQIQPYIVPPGISRDGTTLSNSACSDGQWVREIKGKAKIGGWRQVQDNFTGPVRSCFGFNKGQYTYTVAGSGSALEVLSLPRSGVSGVLVNRTPTIDFVSDNNNVWSFGVMWNSVGTNQVLFAHAAPNLSDIASTTETKSFYGVDDGVTALITIPSAPTASGGLVVLHPYLFIYGNNGLISWCAPNDPTNWSTSGAGSARIAGTKIIKGVPVRGGANAPAGLFWSLDSLYKVSFTGGSTVFRSDYVGGTSLLSTQAVVEYNGLYFFPSVDKFNVYNGTLQELPNDFNKNYFFNGLNYEQRQKVWGFALPRFNEIWWFYPRGTNTECSHYIVYNIAKDVWFDGQLARSAGWVDTVFKRPLYFNTTPITSGVTYQLWEHEYGYDEVVGPQVNAIPSYFETNVFANFAVDPNISKESDGAWVQVDGVEPDLNQVGNMTVQLVGRETGNSLDTYGTVKTFTQTEKFVSIDEQCRQPRLRFESNVQGGYFESGILQLRLRPGSKNFTDA